MISAFLYFFVWGHTLQCSGVHVVQNWESNPGGPTYPLQPCELLP